VADDIGEALDFVVGLAKVGGARVDRGLQIEIVVAQLRFGVIACACGSAHQKDGNARQKHNQTRPHGGHRSRQGLTAVGTRRALDEQMIFFGTHLVGQIVDVAHGVAAGAFTHDPGGVIHMLCLRKRNGFAEFLDPLVAERNHLATKTFRELANTHFGNIRLGGHSGGVSTSFYHLSRPDDPVPSS